MFKKHSFVLRISSILLVLIKTDSSHQISKDSLLSLSLEDRIRYYGYPVETYQVTTEDGYMPTLYRVRHKIGVNLSETGNRSVVLLLHGMGGSPKNFFVLGKESIGLGLVEQDYDVWVLCTRGMECGYEQKHKKLHWNKDQTYWRYTLNELGFYDLPAAIDFVIKKTHQEKLFLLGHSAGSTMQFILLSERPEYNEKVKMAVSYAGTIFLSQANYPLLHFWSSVAKVIGKVIWFNFLNLWEFIPRNIVDMTMDFLKVAVQDPSYFNILRKGVATVGTHTSVLIDYKTHLPFILIDASYRVSAMQIFHYADLVNSGNFMKYDYGRKKNFKIYGQNNPPNYNLTKVTCPIAFFYGKNDEVASRLNTRRAVSQLPNVVMDYSVPFKKFNHIDFIFAKNAEQLVYEPTYKMFKDFDNGILPVTRTSQPRRRFLNRQKLLKI